MNINNFINKDKKLLNHGHHGGEIYNSSLKSSHQVLDFSTNINPLFTHDLIKQSYMDSIHEISKYPDTYSTDLRRELVKYFQNKITIKNLIVSAGSMDLISIFCDTFVNLNDEVIIYQPTFSEYTWAVQKNKGKIINVYRKPEDNFQINSDSVIEEMTSKSKIIFICNPNNPNGLLENPRDLIKIIKIASEKDILIFLDEAFIDFCGESNSLVSNISSYNNLFISRTFTKFFGIPGLRIGFGVSSPEIIDLMNRFQNLWPVNSIAQNIAIKMLRSSALIKETLKLISEEYRFLLNELNQIPGLKIYPSQTNYILLNLESTGFSAPELKIKLLKEGILIRDCSNFEGLDNYFIRINIKTRDLNKKFIASLKEIMRSEKKI